MNVPAGGVATRATSRAHPVYSPPPPDMPIPDRLNVTLVAAVTGGCQTRSKHSIRPSKWALSWASPAVLTLIGWLLHLTGMGALWS